MIDNKAEEKGEKIVEHLSLISSKLNKIRNCDKKIYMLGELNDYLKENGKVIEKVCPEKLISILNSL